MTGFVEYELIKVKTGTLCAALLKRVYRAI